MVSEQQRKHFRSIAAGMERFTRESLLRELELTPGERIAAALRLSDQFLRSSKMEEKPPPVSLAQRWRELRKRDENR